MKKITRILFLFLGMMTWANSQTDSFQDLVKLYNYDQEAPLDFKDAILSKERGVEIHDISYPSPKGGRVTAYLIIPIGKGPFPGIVFGHWGYGTRTEFLPEALLYAQAGVISLLMDYPWVRPAPWRQNMGNFLEPEKDHALYLQTVLDFRRGLDLLESLPSVDSKRIAYIGHSYGAQFGSILAAIEPRIKTAVLIGGVPDLASIYLENNDPDIEGLRNSIPKEKLDEYIKVNRVFDAIQYVPYAAPKPVFFQFANYERYFDEKAMNRYADAAKDPKLVKWYPTGHELNDIQALIDRANWLKDKIGLGPIDLTVGKK